MGFIYGIYSKSQPRAYIGQTINAERRWRRHLNRLSNRTHHNSFLQRHYDKYGADDLEFKVLESHPGMDIEYILTHREQAQINYHQELGYELFNLFLASPSSQYSAESRAKMSASAKQRDHSYLWNPETVAKRAAKRKGIAPTPQCLEASRKACTGRKMGEEFSKRQTERLLQHNHKRKPVLVSGKGLYNREYASLQEAADSLGVGYSAFRNLIQGRVRGTPKHGYSIVYK